MKKRLHGISSEILKHITDKTLKLDEEEHLEVLGEIQASLRERMRFSKTIIKNRNRRTS